MRFIDCDEDTDDSLLSDFSGTSGRVLTGSNADDIFNTLGEMALIGESGLIGDIHKGMT